MDDQRFVETYSQGTLSGNLRRIVVDTQTGVNYLLMSSNVGAGAGACVLVDKDGKPIVTPVR